MSAKPDDTDTARDPPLGVLDVVRDREDDDADDAVVVNTPPVACDEWVARRKDGNLTVAEDNPSYDAEAEVIVVAFRDELAEIRPQFTKTKKALRLAEAEDLDTYAFPPGRLRRVATICPKDDDEGEETDATPDVDGPTLRDRLDAIAAAVEELNTDSVAVDTFREAVVVEKLGVEYVITPDDGVDADDRIAEELEAAAEGAISE